MPSILDRLEKLKAKRRGIRIHDFGNISSGSHLIMEEHSRLGNVRVRLPKADRPLRIGAYSYMREGGEIWNLDSIGRFCSIGRNVVLGQPTDNHPIDWVSSSMTVSKGYQESCNYCSIGHDVWIAHNVVVMAGVKIGNGAVIGRNAVVTKDVEPYQIVVGNPGKDGAYALHYGADSRSYAERVVEYRLRNSRRATFCRCRCIPAVSGGCDARRYL